MQQLFATTPSTVNKDRSNKFTELAVKRVKQVESRVQYAYYTQYARYALPGSAAGMHAGPSMRTTRNRRTLFDMHTTLSTHNICNLPSRAFPPPSLHVRQRLRLGIHLRISDAWIFDTGLESYNQQY
jgi:hypothetical protein